ncbi:MAG TPA: beta-galactosidase GalA [Candidatus Limnocylindrales bacterium]|nr:beta-galactosidase GalA [Candidatus Limnocylindrales bacterium]
MPRWSRRRFLKNSLAASAGAVAAKAALPLPLGADAAPTSSPVGSAIVQAEAAATSVPREKLLLDFGWKFTLGHADDPAKDFGYGSTRREATFAKSGSFPPVTRVNFDDSAWRSVDLPHDWAVELPFDKGNPTLDRNGKPTGSYDLPDHGAKALGREYPETSIGWYRRVFDIPASDAGRRIAVIFDGAFRHAMVMFNGHYIGEEFSGYAPFRFDLTDFVNYGDKNILTVRVDATLGEGWFYEGAGIYRHVRLMKTDPVNVTPSGTYVRSEVNGDSATLFFKTEVQNESGKDRTCRVISRAVDTDGKVVAVGQSKPATIEAGGILEFESQATLSHPRLWSVEEPNLYRWVTIVEADGVIVDRQQATLGIRTVRFDADKGFFLNDKPVKIKGTCNHQDHAGVGAALPDRLQSYRLERLKEMGVNGCRTSHNPPTPEFLDACDRLGMLVMCETRMMSSNPVGLQQVERMIKRFRNHPSIIIWSLGNEEREQSTPRGAKIVATMKRLAKKLDPSRPVTMAMNGGWGKGVSDVVDVQGCNYYEGQIDDFHAKFPKQPMIGTETASHYMTRGIYETDKVKGYVSAYDVNAPSYAKTAEKWWKFYAERPFLAGGFLWTGFDYRGEPSPYNWPCISSHFGAMDTCGFPKDTYFYYQAWWGSKPVLHLFPHWNWSGKEGQEIDVWCHSNLDSVELFLNDVSLGLKKVERNSHVEWKVKYAPGTIEARGSKDGKIVLTDKRETTGVPTGVALRPDRVKISADGEDVSVVVVEVLDAQGRIVPTASNEISFAVAGGGRIIGVGNGDPSCHESDQGAKRSVFNGLCMAIVQAPKQSGEITVSATGDGLKSASVVIRAESAELRPAVA